MRVLMENRPCYLANSTDLNSSLPKALISKGPLFKTIHICLGDVIVTSFDLHRYLVSEMPGVVFYHHNPIRIKTL